MIFLTIWIWSFAIAVVMLIINCYNNPGKMYKDVFIFMICLLAIPGVALCTTLTGFYYYFLWSKAEKLRRKEESWKQVEDIHDMLQMLKGKF